MSMIRFSASRIARLARASACALLITAAIATPAIAQNQGSGTIFKQVDENGVDVSSGAYELTIPLGSLGQGRISLVEYLSGSSGHNLQLNFHRSESGSNVTFIVTTGASREEFGGAKTATSFNSGQGTGAVLSKFSASEYDLITSDGTRMTFAWPGGNADYKGGGAAYCADGNEATCSLLVQTVTAPSLARLTYAWTAGENCRSRTLPNGEVVEDCAQFYRIASVAASGGYKIVPTYLTNTTPTTYAMPPSTWHKRTGATFWNGATQVGTATIAYPSSTVTELTDIGGRTWRVTKNATTQYVTGVRRPGSASDNITISRDANGKVTQVVRDGVTTGYGWSDSGSTRTLTVTNALSQQSVVTTDLTKGRPASFRDQLNRTTSFTYDSNVRLTRTTQPEGNYVERTYDGRGNVTLTKAVAKSGSGLADITTSASFSASCANVVVCNKPNSTTDARGNVTDYTYDASHGGPLTVTAPAPTTGATRPQTRFTYAQQGTGGPWMPTLVSACQTGSSCAGTSDETKTTVTYNTALHASSTTSGDGTGTLAATSAMTYDNRGNLLTVDGPLSGADDTIRYRYDSADQLVGTVGPDPDGAGALKHRAVRTTYRPDGQVSKQERGTANSQSDSDWAAFSAAEAVDIAFDTNNRPITRKLSSGATNYALSQTSYDAIGRPECAAVRMNIAIYGSLPSSACTLGTQGDFGPDRIARTVYDAAGQVTQLKVAFGTSAEANERTLTYSNNGRLTTLKDAENNLTTYEYDGHDRLSKTRFPITTQGANSSSTTDYEQLTYDAASNVTSRRLRDGNSIGFTFDNLNRATFKNLPGSEPDVTYAYDTLGRLTSASQTGHSLSFTYDALSRNLTQAGPQGTVSSQWDLAGRRTRLTYPGSGLYVDYDYLVTGDMKAIRENGAASGIGVLATFGYDDLGRRTSLTYGNSTSTSYSYDAVSRLTALTNDLAGTGNDLTIGSVSYNPASQIMSQTRSNDAFAWTGHGSGSTPGVANGLNQLTSIGGSATAHDVRGNLTADPTTGKTYGYSSENMLTFASGGVSLNYDPGMRLYQLAGASTTRFAYDGIDMIAEYDGNNALQRRFVHGPGMDEPLVQYEGTGTTDRRFLHADERGSVIASSDSSGAMLTINRYDEFGKPQSTNAGRFQYTGQMWLNEFGAYHYKARIYFAHLGRFGQTDPIGYHDGPNLYAYVGNDPVNFVDPLGLAEDPDSGEEVQRGEKIVVTGYRCVTDCGPRFVPSEFLADWEFFNTGTILDSNPPLVDEAVVVVGIREPEEEPSPPPPKPPLADMLWQAGVASGQDWCGTKSSSAVPEGNWGEACRKHDLCYAIPGANKELCDVKLGGNVMLECWKNSNEFTGCISAGIIYGGGVLILGWPKILKLPEGPTRRAYNQGQQGQ